MKHDDATQLLDAYLDDELDAGTTLSLEEHLKECDTCAQWLEARRALLSRVRGSALRAVPPPGLAARIEVLRPVVQKPTALNKAPWMLPWLPALAASLVLLAGGFLLGRTTLVGSSLDAEFVGAHVRSLLDEHAVEVVSSDHHTVKPWFAGRLAFSPPVPELGANGDVLLGGRLEYLEHQRIAVLVYRHGKHLISVFVFPRTAYRAHLGARDTIDGYHFLERNAGDFASIFVSDASAGELDDFARHWVEAAESPDISGR